MVSIIDKYNYRILVIIIIITLTAIISKVEEDSDNNLQRLLRDTSNTPNNESLPDALTPFRRDKVNRSIKS